VIVGITLTGMSFRYVPTKGRAGFKALGTKAAFIFKLIIVCVL
jgi:hypothetical protein